MVKKISSKALSTILMLSLALMMALSLAISVFFQMPSYDGKESISNAYLFLEQDFNSLQEINFINPLGSFTIENLLTREGENQNSSSPSWLLTSPGQLYADDRTLKNIFSSLSQAKIKRVFQKDLINLTNFSLENPLVKITFEYLDGVTRTVSFGLINPLDQSTYATFSDQNNIYQIENLGIPLLSLGLSDFAESRLAPFSLQEIQNVKIFRSDNTQRPPGLSLHYSEETQSFLTSNPHNQIGQEKVQDYLKSLTELRILFILDRPDEKLEKFITNALSRPLYTMQVTLTQKKLINYTVALVNTPIPTIKTDRKQLLLITADNRNHPFLFSRDALDIFSKVDRDFSR